MRAAWVVIGVALVLASGCAQQDWIDRTLVTVDVTGIWERAGSSTVRPRCTPRIAASRSESAARLTTYPVAPAAKAARRYAGTSCIVRTSTFVAGAA